MTSLVGTEVKLERVQVICPACGQQVEAVATDGRVKGYCAVAKQYVDFLIETQLRDSRGCFSKGNVPWNKMAEPTQVRGRDSSGHFVRGNVPWNKRRASIGNRMDKATDR